MLTRRRFSELVTAGAAGVPLWAQRPAAQGLGTDYDVIVIGAGVAGLVAAKQLSAAASDPKVLVLEARDRIGGRVLSADLPSEARDADLGVLHLPDYSGGPGEVGADGSRMPIDALGLVTETLPSGLKTLSPSMGALVGAIAEQSLGKVQLNSPVTGVYWREGLVGVSYENLGLESSVTARRLIVTVPPSVLRRGGLSVLPSLPEDKLSAIESMSGTPAISVAALFSDGAAALAGDEPIWCREETSASYRAFLLGQSEDLLLEAQFRGNRAEALAGQDQELLAAFALRGFSEALETVPLPSAAAWMAVTDWSAEVYSGGARMRVPTSAASLALAAPVSNTLFFAGDATAPSDAERGLAHAYASGERVAREVTRSLQPQAASESDEAPILEPV